MVDKRLFTLVPGVRKLVIGKVVFLWIGLLADIALAASIVGIVAPLVRYAGNDLAFAADVTEFWPSVVMFLAIAVVRFVAHRFATKLGTLAAERVKLGLRSALYRKMLSLGPSYAQHTRTSDVVQLTGEGVDQVQSFFESFLPQLGFAILAPLTLFAVIAPVNMPTAVTLLVCAPLIVIIVGLIAMRTAKTFRKYWGKYTDMGAVFLDDLQGLETLKTFDADGRAAEKMNREAEEFRIMTMRVLQIQLRSLTAMDVVAYGGAAAGIFVAVWQFMHGGNQAFGALFVSTPRLANPLLGLSGVLFVILMAVDFFLPLRQLGSYFHVAMNGMTSSKRIFALLDVPGPQYGAQTLPAGADLGVRAESLGFAYGEDDAKPALHDVTLTMPARSLTAIVGESGSGKSTLAALIAGELEGYTGSLRFADGNATVELRDCSEDALMHAVSIVGARSHLFAGTLRDNLLMAKPDATDEELRRALADAHILDFIDAQSDGLDMRIEQDAANLSGGQRQRVAVARALLRDTPIMIFDEATSSVDADSERLIMETVHKLAEHKTVLLITHRLADAVAADNIAVFADGGCVETGAHDALIAADGVYATMFRTQQDVEQVGKRKEHAGIRYAQDMTAQSRGVQADGSDSPAPTTQAAKKDAPHEEKPTMRLIGRLLGQVGSLRPLMIVACVFGTLGHVAATFLPVFGTMALFAAFGRPVWGMGAGWALAVMIVCALIRGAMRYCEQYMNHNLAFRLLALFRAKMFAALRRLAPAKLAGKGKGDLVSMVTTDVELLEIFCAHTISPTVIAISTTLI
ncbi:MAG: ATP-binding cassette domain-containing protein, partial [Bifidobacterium castoris]|nr:ATP-binding cassette domain-containing protein [Bifidobacterium castoris]